MVELGNLKKVTNISIPLMFRSMRKHVNVIGSNAYVNEDVYKVLMSYYSTLHTRIVDINKIQKTTVIPIVPGYYVYFLFNLDEVIYIGQSGDLLGRLAAHKCDKKFDSVYYLNFDTPHEMHITEQVNIRHYRPDLNKNDFADGKVALFKHLVDLIEYENKINKGS
jgi:hypothetical protein